jgi:hypothetical protein
MIYIGILLKLIYKIMLRINIISDYRYNVLLCCGNIRHYVLITIRLALLSSVTSMSFNFSRRLKRNLVS